MRVDADLLLGYYDAVHEQTLQYLDGIGEADLDRIVDRRWDPRSRSASGWSASRTTTSSTPGRRRSSGGRREPRVSEPHGRYLARTARAPLGTFVYGFARGRLRPERGRSHTHLCRVFDDHADFRAAAVEFLADGLARGCRVRYIAAGDEETLRAELAPLERLPEAQRPGAVEVLSVSGTYAGTERASTRGHRSRSTPPKPPARRWPTVSRASGSPPTSRCSSARPRNSTPSPATSTRSSRYITPHRSPRSAATGGAELGDDTVAQLACLHPGGGAEQAPFRMHATPDADLALSGELDLTTVDLFAAAVDRAGLDDDRAEVVVDARGLEFADHRNLLVLERMADRYGRSVVLRTSRQWPERLVAALGLARVRVEHQGT